MSEAAVWSSVAVAAGVALMVQGRLGAVHRAMADALLEGARDGASANTTGSTPVPAPAGQERRHAWILGGAMLALFRAMLGASWGIQELPFAALGALGGEVVFRASREASRKKLIRRIEFHLPNTMERIVMGVSSGLDVLPAMKEAARDGGDPVSECLRDVVRTAESGMPVADALRFVAGSAPSAALQHSLVHLAIAHQQGGEVIRPIKELCDATQASFQESVEEQIAKLPVKAVLPLVVTFAGLIVCFVTIPLMQVGAITKRAAHAQIR